MLRTIRLRESFLPLLLDFNCIIVIIIEHLLCHLLLRLFLVLIIPELAKLPLKPLQGGAMAVCPDEVRVEIHIRVAELVIVRRQVVGDYFCRRLFYLQFNEFLFRQLFPDRGWDLRYLILRAGYVFPACFRGLRPSILGVIFLYW